MGKENRHPSFPMSVPAVTCNSSCVLTPAANRNSYRVAIIVVSLTQGSELRPQPWAGKSQLCQSCSLSICCHGFCCDCNGGLWVNKRITPAANRNSYRVAKLVGELTQGSGLRPQPWAGKSQLRQSCRCLRKPSPALVGECGV